MRLKGRPISRREALEIARKTMLDAEFERLQAAMFDTLVNDCEPFEGIDDDDEMTGGRAE